MEAITCFDLFKSLFSTDLISAFIGAIIGGLFTMWATTHAHALMAKTQRRNEQTMLYDTTKLIQVEISTAIKIFQEEYGKELQELADGEPYICVFPIGSNTFPIYDSSPACLSNLPPDLSELLVRIYMRAKGLIAMIEINNAESERVQKLAQDLLNERLPKISDIDRLNELYRQDISKQANIIDMGSTADGMKLLIAEILELKNKADELIKNLKKPSGR